MKKYFMTGLLAGMFAGCGFSHHTEYNGRNGALFTEQFPPPQTKTQAIASYLRVYGQNGERGAKCGSLHTDTGTLTICYVDLNKPFDYTDDILYFGFQVLDHTCIDVGLNDTLDDVVLDGTDTPIPVKDTKPEFQEFVSHEYNAVIKNTYRAMRLEGLL